MSYTPRAIDTSGITLSPDVKSLVARLAEHNRDDWAKNRFSEGWKYEIE